MNYYSQFGEDKYIIENIPIPVIGTFVDVGAGDGIKGSNSKAFEDMGWNGICVEPDPRNFAKCNQARRRTLNVCVSNKEIDTGFCTHKIHPDLSGLGKTGAGFQQIPVHTLRLDTILKQEGIRHIDLLSIDTEGTELDVMDSFDLEEYTPEIIIIEYITLHTVNHAIRAYFEKLAHYKMVRDHASNLIYLRV